MAGTKVTCPICGVVFNANKEPAIKVGARWYHQKCADENDVVKKHEEKVKKQNTKICVYCKKTFDTRNGYKKVQNRYAHPECFEKYHTEDEEYIEQIYSFLKEHLISYDYVQCEKQRQSYVSKYGYTNKGMLTALKYFYDVRKQSPDRSGNRIGIIPYVYDEAQKYFEDLEKRKKKANEGLIEQVKIKPIVIEIKGEQKRKPKGYIDLDTIGGE